MASGFSRRQRTLQSLDDIVVTFIIILLINIKRKKGPGVFNGSGFFDFWADS